MKNMLLIAILVFAQIGFAANEKKAATTTHASATERINTLKESSSYKEAVDALKKGKALSANQKKFLVTELNSALSGVEVSAVNIENLILLSPDLLLNIHAKANIIKSSASSEAQKTAAVLDLKALDAAGRTIDVNNNTKNKDGVETYKAELDAAIQVSKVDASSNEQIANFKKDFIQHLENNKSISEALKAAAAKYATAKNMTVDEWLKKFKELC